MNFPRFHIDFLKTFSLLFHNFVMTFIWLLNIFCPNCIMIYSWTFPDFLKNFHGFPITYSSFSYKFLICLSFSTHFFLKTFLWFFFYGFLGTFLLLNHEFFMTFWCLFIIFPIPTHYFLMTFICIFHDYYMIFSRPSHDFCVTFS